MTRPDPEFAVLVGGIAFVAFAVAAALYAMVA